MPSHENSIPSLSAALTVAERAGRDVSVQLSARRVFVFHANLIIGWRNATRRRAEEIR